MGSTGTTYDNGKESKFNITGAKKPNDDELKAANFDSPSKKNFSAINKATKGENIIFQFTKVSNDRMSIKAYQPGQPTIKALVKVDINKPSLDVAAKSGSSSEVQKLRALFGKSRTGVTESNLPEIAAELKRRDR